MTGAERDVAAAGLVGGLLDGCQRRAVHVGGDDVGQVAVAEAADAAQGRFLSAGEPDRRAVRLARRGLHRHVLERAVELAVVGDGLAGEEFAQHGDALGQTRATLVVRDVAGGVFARELAADPDAQDEAALGQVIQRDDLLCHRRRVAQRQQQHGCAQASGGG